MFVSLSFRGEVVNDLQLAGVIDKVVYKLHPTFKASAVTAHPPKFTHTCTGWGTFDVGCTIHWKNRLGIQPTVVSHSLVFAPGGARTATILPIEDHRLAVLFN